MYKNLSPEDRRLNIEGRVLDVLSQHGGTRLVSGPKLAKIVQEITDEIIKMSHDGLIK